jgi:hypothetical protein
MTKEKENIGNANNRLWFVSCLNPELSGGSKRIEKINF